MIDLISDIAVISHVLLTGLPSQPSISGNLRLRKHHNRYLRHRLLMMGTYCAIQSVSGRRTSLVCRSSGRANWNVQIQNQNHSVLRNPTLSCFHVNSAPITYSSCDNVLCLGNKIESMTHDSPTGRCETSLSTAYVNQHLSTIILGGPELTVELTGLWHCITSDYINTS